jgi:molecular chaperone GrpE
MMTDEDSLEVQMPEEVCISEAEPSEIIGSNSAFCQNRLGELVQSVIELKADFEAKIKYDQSKECTINLLHQELQDYRNDLNLTYLRPLAMDFLALYDSISKVVERFQVNVSHIESENFVGELEEFLQDLEDSLSRHGFEVYKADTEQVDRSLQHVQKTLSTSNPDLDRRVAARLRKGLRYGERILRPEGISAYCYSAPSPNSAESLGKS